MFAERIGGLLAVAAGLGRRRSGRSCAASVLGFVLGILPGGGAVIASFCQLRPGEEGVAARPSASARARSTASPRPRPPTMPPPAAAFIPLMTLGIPPNVVMALLLGAFIIHGLQPGPLLMTQKPDLFWGIVASMYIGNVMLLILNMPLIGMWVQVLKLPYRILFPLILMFCVVGVYASGNAVFDVLRDGRCSACSAT